jgi:predicted nucleic acid-binding protein
VIVVDASAILEILLKTHRAPKVESLIFKPGVTLHAPHLLDLEIAQGLRRYLHLRDIDEDRAQEAWLVFSDLPLVRYPHTFMMSRIWELRHNVTAYDAAYIALAEELRAPLVTRDIRLRTAHGHRAKIVIP